MMRELKKVIAILLAILALSSVFVSCTEKDASESGKLKVVATIFPQYDFVRAVAKDKVELTMLLSPGKESHTYDPTAKDMFLLNSCDVFIYGGGESDTWADTVVASAENKNMTVIAMMDCVKLYEEEIADGMQSEEESENGDEKEYDEHVWTSPVNAKLIVQKICDVLCSKDKTNADFYKTNTEEYIKELECLDEEIKSTVNGAKRKYIVVADRFPLRYFVENYGLSYTAAFPGCSSKTEPNPKTIAYIIDKVKSEDIKAIFKIELSDGYTANAVAEAANAEVFTFYSCHNISKDDFESGETYLSLMYKNNEKLKIALN